ncbi:MAG TPA: hypothetical protein VK634_17170 [Reyranella sp.]|nr:hypothetical protein [Reyranella sp.]HTE82419.1 hypothetical protein [Reyranella sp.]
MRAPTQLPPELGDMSYLRDIGARVRTVADAIVEDSSSNMKWKAQLEIDADAIDETATRCDQLLAMLFLLTAIDTSKPQ